MKLLLSEKKEWQKIDPETGEEAWKSFKYELACTELCGKSHYAMQMDVIVHEDEESFMEWAKEQKPYYETMKALGEIETTSKMEDSQMANSNK